MFDYLTNKLSLTLRNISNSGRLTEANIKETLLKVRIALLEADVAFPVVIDFINNVKNKAIGSEINKSLSPGQEFINIVRNELIFAMGKENHSLNLAVQPPAVILIVGLQGAGKTTTVAKLGNYLRYKYKKKILLVSVDTYRPAAIKQLEILAKLANLDIFNIAINTTSNPIDIVKAAFKEAKLKFFDILLIDTAGCLNINELIFKEIKEIYRIINPIETLFIIDAMLGQDAANTAKAFNEAIKLTGIILTKVDSDSRGGAALSIRYITGKPIKFIGVGETIEAIEPFYPNRIASRILGMGDILSIIDNIQYNLYDKNCHINKLPIKFKKNNNFNLVDFLEYLRNIKNIDGITSLITKLPKKINISDEIKFQINDKNFIHMEAIINSMTIKERNNPEIIKGSRKRRIAAGCGMQVQEVNRLLKYFYEIQKIINRMNKSKIGIAKIIKNIKSMMSPNF